MVRPTTCVARPRRTTSTSGGEIMGYGSSATNPSLADVKKALG